MVETHDRFHALAINLMGVSIVKLGRNNSWCIHGAVEFAQEEVHKLFWKRSAIQDFIRIQGGHSGKVLRSNRRGTDTKREKQGPKDRKEKALRCRPDFRPHRE